MWDVIVYPFLELLMLLLFCHGVKRRELGFRSFLLALGVLLLYIQIRYYLISSYDALILVFRIVFFTVFCRIFFTLSWKNSVFISACLSLFLHAVIVLYYNLPLISGFVHQWAPGDFIAINILRAGLVLWLSRSIPEVAHARIGLTEWLLVFVSYLGYCFDLRKYIEATADQATPLEVSFVLFMYCMATTISVIAALWHIVSAQRQGAVQHMEKVLQQQYFEWNQKTERDAAISRMYHDLKRQINLIGNLENDAARELTQTLRECVEDFTSIPDTGSAILNTLLGEKTQQCKEKHITFSCVTQFQTLAPLQGMDICAIVGNALDNAIEACERMPEDAKREINLRILQTDAFLAFKVENTFAGVLKKERGKIISSKVDADNHGIGLDSIRYSTEKYGGEMNIETSSERFTLKVIIPTT